MFMKPNQLYINIFVNNLIKIHKNSFFPRVQSRMTT